MKSHSLVIASKLGGALVVAGVSLALSLGAATSLAPEAATAQASISFQNWASRYVSSALPARNGLAAEGLQLAQQRHALLSELIRSNPQKALALALPDATLAQMPAAIRQELETHFSTVGDYSVLGAVQQLHGPAVASVQRTVRVGGHSYHAYVFGQRATATTQHQAPLQGIILGEDAALADAPSQPSPLGLSPNPLSAWTTGLKKVLVLRVDFSDIPGAPEGLTQAAVTSVADTEVKPYYAVSSYAQTSLSNTVSSTVYRMPQTANYYAINNANDQLHQDAETAAAVDFTMTDYDRIIVYFPFLGNIANSGITYGGLAEVAGTNVWCNGEFDFRVIAHELGHTYGLLHGNLWQVTDGNPISATGTDVEYGDDYDTMGANFANDHATDFNPWFKNMLGWIPDNNITTVTTDGTYRLFAFDHHNSLAAPGELRGLVIPKDSVRSYWIGYRGNFARTQNGAYIIWGYDFNRQSDLLDMTTPGLSDSDAALNVGATFSDPAAGDKGVVITPVATGGVSPNLYLDVNVNVGHPPPPPPAQLQLITNVISGGNGNGLIDPNECNNLTVIITNATSTFATGLQGVLTSDAYPDISLGTSIVPFPDVPPHSTVSSSIPFSISSSPDFPCGTPVKLGLTVKYDQGVFATDLVLATGVVGSPNTFANTPVQPISIPTGATGLMAPVTVSGLQSAAKITVSAYVTAQFDAGMTLNLISPNGTTIALASGEGGLGANFGAGCGLGAATTFDDSAATAISAGTAPFIGSFLPEQPLSTFALASGANLNGIWQLQVIDQFPGDAAQLQCWSMTVTPYVCSPGTGSCAGSDLSVTMVAQPNPSISGSNFVCTLVASNSGPSVATDVTVQQVFDGSIAYITSTNLSQGSAFGAGNGVTWTVGALPVGGVATNYVVLLARTNGPTTITATIGSPSLDPNTHNNVASTTVLVTRPGADLGVTIVAQPNPVLENGRLTYTVVVTNNGPFRADSVLLTTLIPNANFISGTTSQGVVDAGGVQTHLNTINAGAGAVVTLVVSPVVTGTISAVASVSLSSAQTDPISANNIAVTTTTVNASADLAVSATVTPNPSIAGSNVFYVATVTNRGPANASDVTLSQVLPPGSRFVSSSVSGSALQTNGNTLVWSVGVLSNGVSATITNTITASINVGPSAPPAISTFTTLGQPGDPNTNNNVFVLSTVNSNAFIKIVAAGSTLLSGGSSISPGDRVTVALALQNAGNIPTAALNATLLAGGGVTAPAPSTAVNFGVVAPGAIVTNTVTFTAVGVNGGVITAQVAVADGGVSLGNVSFVFTLPVVATFSNPTSISIPDPKFVPLPDSGYANPYPAPITVSNISGLVSQVTVTISNLSHAFPNDVAMLLVSPTGLKSILMAGAPVGSQVSHADVTFDQTAGPLPSSGAIVSGSYQPFDLASSLAFPAPAPVGPYLADLSVFSGVNPNGVWSLYVLDTGDGDTGSIAGGWSLAVKTITPVNQVADLGIAVSASDTSVLAGGSNTFTVTVTNAGPNAAVASVLSASASGQSTTNLGSIAPGGSLTYTTTLAITGVGLQTNRFTVLSSVFDPAPANNSVTLSTTGTSPVADVVALIPAPVGAPVFGRNLTYTVVVSNAGPQVARSATGSFSLAGLGIPSASVSQGSVLITTAAVACSFGDIAAGNIASAQITVAPQVIGALTNTWTVGTASSDLNLANNTATVVLSALNPAPIVTGGGATLLASGSQGAIFSNATVSMSLVLSNIGYLPTTNLVATLQASGGVTPVTTSQNYGVIAAGASKAEPFTFVTRGAPGATVTATLALTDGAFSYGTATFSFVLPSSLSVSNGGAIVIPSFGPATPYPSAIMVSQAQGVVSKVTATLHGFSHSFPKDVSALLVSPQGESAVLMAHTGGAYSVTNLTLTFDDAASNSLPSTFLSSGTYLGTELAPIPVFPGFTAVYNTSLSVFEGADPNGAWALYVNDDSAGNDGVISQGWSLNFSLVSPVNPISRLAVLVSHAPATVLVNNVLNYQIVVTNLGPTNAESVVLTTTIPTSAIITGASASQGSVAPAVNGVVTANLGTIPANEAVVVNITAIPTVTGSLISSSTVSTTSLDPFGGPFLPVGDVALVTSLTPSSWQASLAGTNVQLTLTGQSGQTYVIESSTDLVHWTSMSAPLNGSSYSFTVSGADTNAPQMFYRAVHMPQ
ncbi:MAG TPA: proprotein convertase P-domain-containing protein [Verrucomicrobiae bacterium]|jgi:uncharacterized repeat protein (TIGR01451 family)|nr:proprotein convertase P-domain-containing protein [Verrucomicrobiae bacterium]